MSNTKIEWTQKTWNPITGCTPISAGCDNCYAKRAAWSPRLRGKFGYPADDPFRVTFHPDRLEAPLHWRKPSKIFVNSMGDLFHSAVTYHEIEKVYAIINQCPQHVFQILTKRPSTAQIQYSRIQSTLFKHAPHPNVWLGVTVENAKYKNRIEVLRTIPAAVRFISFEPLLGDVGKLDLTGIHWVIVGGETGPGARAMDRLWVGKIHRQCLVQDVPFFFKKWGPHYTKDKQTMIAGREWREFPKADRELF
jgi:protein gp37